MDIDTKKGIMRWKHAAILLMLFALAPALHAQDIIETETTSSPVLDSGNTAWILTSSLLVLLMSIPGIALFYGGLVRQKNVLSVIMQTLFIVGVVLIKVTNTKSLGKRYSYNETFDVATIDNMEINFSAGDLNIKKSSDENIHVTGENLPEKINFSSSNSKLQVKTADSLLHLKGGYISFDGSQPTLTIELPEKAFDTVKIDAGAGQMKLSDLTCENLDIDFGAGSSEVINVTCKNEADFDLGVGKTVFKDCTFNDSDFDCGVGETDFSGKLLGDADIDGGIGSINFDIDGCKNDYKIKSDSKVKINSTSEENELLYKIKLDIDNGIGEISLNFR